MLFSSGMIMKTGEKIYYNGELAKESENYIYDEYGNPLYFKSRQFFPFPFPTTGSLSSGYFFLTFLNLLDEKLRIVQKIKYAYDMPSEIWEDYRYDESGNPVYWFYYNRQHVTRTYKIDWYQTGIDPEIVFYPSAGTDQILWEYSFLDL